MATKKLKIRFQQVFTLMLTAPLIVLAAVMMLFYYQSFKQHTIEANSQTTQLLTRLLNQRFQEVENRLSALAFAMDHELIEMTNPLLFERFVTENESIVDIRILDKTGSIVHISPPNDELL